MDQAHLFAIGVLLAWLAGIRVYLTVFGVGIAGFFGWLPLPEALQATQSPWVLGVSGALAAAEFFADKIPGVDSVWDLLHTLLRIPAGAFLAAAAMSPDGQLGAGMLATGAGVALTSHLVKAGSRALLNTSPEPVSNWTASVTEDVAVVGGLALAFSHPWIALALVVAISVAFALGVWWLWRKLFRRAPRPGAG
ncbi:MAG: DUF4126 domain-containing protein [Xanthomonadales bacterium]|jgi:hypothetical protein|uniref:DUF4126 domain-containing protein n=1 Tax=Thermomonas mangrovi TaxID=2993316 RepID=UPI001AC2C0B3|nr:DUF4126 domain-containing protein [Thermomonas mangrovi]MBN8263123.1 DUF4126 domain-containing protein [Xanthomonadales bacterium]